MDRTIDSVRIYKDGGVWWVQITFAGADGEGTRCVNEFPTFLEAMVYAYRFRDITGKA